MTAYLLQKEIIEMNHARTTYQTDYGPFEWFQNNVLSVSGFCSPENVDECLKYISQELSALGYPPIYSDTTECPFAVNCDIVNFLNATFELLKCNSECTDAKEDLESRNLRLCSDLNSLNRKNSVLKTTLEQTEKKLACALERERQLKGRNEQLCQQLKTEKEETKKLVAQVRQQKVAFQHEVRKYETNFNHIKAKLNQLLSDKNPTKKIANIIISQTLQRNFGQRGKWKNGPNATTAIEDMYNSLISTYETRAKDLYKELSSFRQCMQSVLLKLLEIVSPLQDGKDGQNYSTSEDFVISEIKKESRDVQSFEEKFEYLFSILEETAKTKVCKDTRDLEDQITVLKSKLSQYEKATKKCEEPMQVNNSECTDNTDMLLNKVDIAKSFSETFIAKVNMRLEAEKKTVAKSLENIEKEVNNSECTDNTDMLLNKEDITKSLSETFITKENMKLKTEKITVAKSLENIEKEVKNSECTDNTDMLLNKEDIAKSFAETFIKKEKMRLEAEKKIVAKSLENIEKEKAALSAQKLAILRVAIQQKAPSSSWHDALHTSPSISVITSQGGSTKISTANELKASSSVPGQIFRSLSPQWPPDEGDPVLHTSSDTILLKENVPTTQPTVYSPFDADNEFSNNDLPSWAVNAAKVQNIVIDDMENSVLEISRKISTDAMDLQSESSEEMNLIRLEAAMQDIEERKSNIS